MRQPCRITLWNVIFASIVLAAAPCRSAGYAWTLGDWWQLEQQMDMELAAESFQSGSFMVTRDHTRYTVVDRGIRVQQGAGGEIDAYVVALDGTGSLNIDGTFYIANLSFEIRLVNGGLTGEQWYRAEDLALAMTTLRMSGMLEGKGLDGEWRPFGQFVLANREEFDPPLPLGFPLEVGRSFSSNHTAYLSGAYELVFAGLPINNSYEKQQAWTVNGQIVSLENQTDCQFQDPSYRVEMTYLQDGQTGAKSLWIEPRIKSFNKEVRSQFQHPLGVIRSSVLCLTAAHVAQDPEPSPTPSPKFIDLQLRLNKSEFLAGDGFELRISADNSGVPVSARLFVVLDISALGVAEPYYFWPSWIHFPHGVDSALWELPAGFAEQTLLSFIWPAGAGSSAGLAFWAAALDPSGMELWGEIATVKFGFR